MTAWLPLGRSASRWVRIRKDMGLGLRPWKYKKLALRKKHETRTGGWRGGAVAELTNRASSGWVGTPLKTKEMTPIVWGAQRKSLGEKTAIIRLNKGEEKRGGALSFLHCVRCSATLDL